MRFQDRNENHRFICARRIPATQQPKPKFTAWRLVIACLAASIISAAASFIL